MQSLPSNADIIQSFLGPLLIMSLISLIPFILGLILLVKIWNACSDLEKVKDNVDNIAYWTNARYASEKRRGLIIEDDLRVADNVSENK